MAQSDNTQPLVDQLREEGRRRGLSEAEIEAKLQEAGYVPPPTGIGHILGLGARGVLQGIDAAAAVNPMTAAANAGNMIAGSPFPGGGTTSANELGTPQPVTPGEKLGVAGVEGAVGAVPFAALSGGIGPAASLLASSAAGGVASEKAKQSGMGPIGQAVVGALVTGGIQVANALAAGAIKSVFAGAAARRAQSREALALIQGGDPNAPVSLGQVAPGTIGARIQGGIKNLPGGGPIATSGAAQAKAMGGRLDEIMNKTALPAENTQVGEEIQRSIKDVAIPHMYQTAANKWAKVEAMVPPEAPTMLPSTTRLFTEQSNLVDKARPLLDETLGHPEMMKWSEKISDALVANPGGLPFDQVKAFRTLIGEKAWGRDPLVPEMQIRDLRKIYVALTSDMAEAVKQHGGMAALQEWNAANQYWARSMDKVERVLQPIVDKRTPQQVWDGLRSGSRQGDYVVKQAMSSMGPSTQKMVARHTLQMAGKPNAGIGTDEFSPEVFLTNWKTYSPEARRVLAGALDPEMEKNLGTLVRAIELRKDAAKVMANPSGTAGNVAFQGLLGALAAGGVAMGAGVATGNLATFAKGTLPFATLGGINVAARAFTSPKIVSWMVSTTKIPYSAIGAAVSTLARQSRNWPEEDRQSADELVSALGRVDWNKVGIAKALADVTSVSH